MANNPAKNMSSLDSHTIVPTLTMFGLFSECTRALMVGDAVVTKALCLPATRSVRSGPWRVDSDFITLIRTESEDYS
jgi:hypothetical protein